MRRLGNLTVVGLIALVTSTSLMADDAKPAAPAAPAVKKKPVADNKSATAKSVPSPVLRIIRGAFSSVAAEPTADLSSATHEQFKTTKVEGKNGTTLQTLTVQPNGMVVGLVAPSRYAVKKASGDEPAVCEVVLFDLDGEERHRWPLKFTAQSVAAGPDGAIYVAGEGQLQKFDGEGQSLQHAELPHLAEVLKNKDKLRDQAEAQLKAQIESVEKAYRTFEKQVQDLEAKQAGKSKGKSDRKDDDSESADDDSESADDDSDDSADGDQKTRKPSDGLTASEATQLRAFKSNLQRYETVLARYRKQNVEDVLAQTTSRLRTINGITVTDKDVFVACGELKGYGYAIWRMGLDFSEPQQVLSQIGGCCGQMDVQARGDDLFIAENTRHRVAHYNRDGQQLGTFGSKGRVSEGLEFGGCCNPMNCRIAANGDIYTAESEGIVKRFSADGEFLGLVGKAALTGGCKNVAVAASPDARRVYFCDLPGSRLIILAQKEEKVAAAKEENDEEE